MLLFIRPQWVLAWCFYVVYFLLQSNCGANLYDPSHWTLYTWCSLLPLPSSYTGKSHTFFKLVHQMTFSPVCMNNTRQALYSWFCLIIENISLQLSSSSGCSPFRSHNTIAVDGNNSQTTNDANSDRNGFVVKECEYKTAL